MSVDGSVEGGLAEPTELEPEQGSLDLASPDDRYTRSDWEAATAAVLRKMKRMTDDDADALVWDKLTRTTLDGIDVAPLGTPDLLDGLQTAGRPTRTGDWDVRALHARPDNEELILDLNGGVTSLWLRVDGDTDFEAVLGEVLLDLAAVVLDAGDAQVEAAEAFLDVLGDTPAAPGTNLGGGGASLVEVARLAQEAGVLGVVVDATVAHDRGASDVQELGYSMAIAAAYLRELTDAGFSVDEAAGLMEFRYAATDEQFPQIAKLRAARRLWARVLELSGAEAIPQRQHVVTSRPMMSKYDPYVNMLRTTVAAFAAGVGGADSVTVLPFDSPLGRPETLGRRIARNTSPLLMWESHVAKVADPAGGSYAVEKLTDDLAVAAWGELGRIESDGLDAFHERVGAVVALARRTWPSASGRSPGSRSSPTWPRPCPSARPTTSSPMSGPTAPASRPCATTLLGAGLPGHPRHRRGAHRARHLRDQPLRRGRHRGRPCGPTAGVDELLAAYDGQAVVCLAGSDPTYAEWGSEAIAALREAGAQHVIIAGKQRDDVDDSCAMGIDALDFLTRTREKLA